MILGFKKQFPWGKPTKFVEKILLSIGEMAVVHSGNKEKDAELLLQRLNKYVDTTAEQEFYPKLHTIREGERIKPGTVLHMATGVRTKQYNQFNKGIAELEKCVTTQGIYIYVEDKEVFVATKETVKGNKRFEWNYQKLSYPDLLRLSLNDGFDTLEDFWRWFSKDTIGQIIHWTDLIYKT